MTGMRQFYRSVLAPAEYKEVAKTENGISMFGYFHIGRKPDEVPPFWLKTLPHGQAVPHTVEITIPSYGSGACELTQHARKKFEIDIGHWKL